MPYIATHIEFYFCWVPDFKVYKVHYDVVIRMVYIYKRTRIAWKDSWDLKTTITDVDCYNRAEAEQLLQTTAGL